ncbi:5-(carboxyamino)imidazole ribonucleotide synthase [bacterium]|nr:5-(carboxyamino)imidazole ribonucleotide synthase [bacterium]
MKRINTHQFKLGIIGGGQLGKMIAQAASRWDIKTHILDPDENCPSSETCTAVHIGSPLSYDDILEFGKKVDLITFEIENVNIESLKELKKQGLPIYPDPNAMELIQDKGLQKNFYAEHNFKTADYQLFEGTADIIKAAEDGQFDFPFVQKLRKGGYDGKGVQVIKDKSSLSKLLPGPSLVETAVKIDKELSVIASRNPSGEIKCFPTVEMDVDAEANLVDMLICPAKISQEIATQATEVASRLIEELDVCGLLAVEFFLDTQGELWINEVAPRPHNSGHHTIESVLTSQFEQLIRAVLDFPLGSTALKMPAAMINLLGSPDHTGLTQYVGVEDALKIEGLYIHIYGKATTSPYRKMGHVTLISPSLDEAISNAKIAKQTLKVIA